MWTDEQAQHPMNREKILDGRFATSMSTTLAFLQSNDRQMTVT